MGVALLVVELNRKNKEDAAKKEKDLAEKQQIKELHERHLQTEKVWGSLGAALRPPINRLEQQHGVLHEQHRLQTEILLCCGQAAGAVLVPCVPLFSCPTRRRPCLYCCSLSLQCPSLLRRLSNAA